jgi:hypothetical protein
MAVPLTVLGVLGATVAEEFEVLAPERAAALDLARERFLRETPNERKLRALLTALGLAAALALLGWFALSPAAPTMAFRVNARAGRTHDPYCGASTVKSLVASRNR